MTAKILSVICYVIAGFFIYTVAILAFTITPSAATKTGIMFGFSIPAIIALFAGFAFDQFRHKLRDTGIVLMSSAGFTLFLVFTLACLLRTDEFKKMMKPETMAFFSDYVVGFGFLIFISAIGLVTFRIGTKKPNEASAMGIDK